MKPFPLRHVPFAALVLGSVWALPARAYQLSSLSLASDSQFHQLTGDLLAALGPKGLPGPSSPASGGFGLAAFATATYTADPGTWSEVTGTRVKDIDVAGVDAWYFFPHELRVGLSVGAIANTADVVWALDASMPVFRYQGWGVTAQGSVSLLARAHDLNAYTQALGLELSHAYGSLVPYASAGVSVGEFDPVGDATANSDVLVRPEGTLGLRWNRPSMAVNAMVDQTGHNTGLGLRISIGF